MSVCAPDAVEQAVQHVLVNVDTAGNISCAPAQLNVTGSDVLITFLLSGSDWAFADSEAVVVSGGGSQFPIPSWTVNNKQAALLDCNTQPGSFSYTVTVQHVVTGHKRSMDPTIKNEV